MDARTRELVRQRANQRCEYCHFPERTLLYLVFHVDHIIAKQHVDEASDDPQSLAWACSECNYHKGPNLVSIDPQSKEQADLFNLRHDDWNEHFTIDAGTIPA
jgi:HNH endonuclease